jgi:hypothetical protein
MTQDRITRTAHPGWEEDSVPMEGQYGGAGSIEEAAKLPCYLDYRRRQAIGVRLAAGGTGAYACQRCAGTATEFVERIELECPGGGIFHTYSMAPCPACVGFSPEELEATND